MSNRNSCLVLDWSNTCGYRLLITFVDFHPHTNGENLIPNECRRCFDCFTPQNWLSQSQILKQFGVVKSSVQKSMEKIERRDADAN